MRGEAQNAEIAIRTAARDRRLSIGLTPRNEGMVLARSPASAPARIRLKAGGLLVMEACLWGRNDEQQDRGFPRINGWRTRGSILGGTTPARQLQFPLKFIRENPGFHPRKSAILLFVAVCDSIRRRQPRKPHIGIRKIHPHRKPGGHRQRQRSHRSEEHTSELQSRQYLV